MPNEREKLKWERNNDDVGIHFEGREFGTMRAKVPGGWLVCAWMISPGRFAGIGLPDAETRVDGGGLTFLPDPDHSWK